MLDEIEAIARDMQDLRGREDDRSKRRADTLMVHLVELVLRPVPERVARTAREVVAAYETVQWFQG